MTSARSELCERAIWLEGGHIRMAGDVFPVTGHYMEYLFDDCRPSDVASAIDVSNSSSVSSKDDLDHNPITHWGSHIGCIKQAGVCTA